LPRDAWGADEGPTLLATADGPGALELVTEPRIPSGLTPAPAPRDTRAEAKQLLRRAQELQGLDDHSGAREVLLRVQALHPELPGLPEALTRSEARLQTSYESKIGKLSSIPRVRLKDDEVIWLNLDHRAGFMLAQIDGTLSFEDLFSVSGMSRLTPRASWPSRRSCGSELRSRVGKAEDAVARRIRLTPASGGGRETPRAPDTVSPRTMAVNSPRAMRPCWFTDSVRMRSRSCCLRLPRPGSRWCPPRPGVSTSELELLLP
jgi:hypothetical protein